jgi:BirA family transcriptional regulator, biotin operon repressor / biotin---[acetyl-CoA-carboxylase] ligase
VTLRFDAERFRTLVAPGHVGLGRELTATAVTDSTNDDAFAAAAAGAPDGAVFVSDAQRAGRGRRGNTWLSVSGEGLLFSALLRRRFPAESMGLVPLATGLAVRAAVARRLTSEGSAVTPSLKWPNDVLADGRKLAGILVESRVRGQGEPVTVIGVGLNLGRLPAEIGPSATSLRELGVPDRDREGLLCDLLAALDERLRDLGTSGGEARVVTELGRFDGLRGTRVSIGGIVGVAAGIDPSGRLLITDERGELHKLRSGHVETA